MIKFLKGVVTCVVELFIGTAWALLMIAGVVVLWLFAYGLLMHVTR